MRQCRAGQRVEGLAAIPAAVALESVALPPRPQALDRSTTVGGNPLVQAPALTNGTTSVAAISQAKEARRNPNTTPISATSDDIAVKAVFCANCTWGPSSRRWPAHWRATLTLLTSSSSSQGLTNQSLPRLHRRPAVFRGRHGRKRTSPAPCRCRRQASMPNRISSWAVALKPSCTARS